MLRYFGDSGFVAEGAMMSQNQRRNPEAPSFGFGLFGHTVHDQYSDARVAHDFSDSASAWWPSSPGSQSYHFAFVSGGGFINLGGFSMGIDFGVRPALWLNLAT